MRVRWTSAAADDLSKIVDYIRRDNPAAARRVAKTVFNGVTQLRKFPHIGRMGLADNTRELIFTPLPYIVVYEILGDQVHVLRIRHAAQDLP
jgi:addiction module RelE/StbE family toxin